MPETAAGSIPSGILNAVMRWQVKQIVEEKSFSSTICIGCVEYSPCQGVRGMFWR